MTHDPFHARKSYALATGGHGTFYSLAALEEAGLGKISFARPGASRRTSTCSAAA